MERVRSVNPREFVTICSVFRPDMDFVFGQTKLVEVVRFLGKFEIVDVNDRVRPAMVDDVASARIVTWYEAIKDIKSNDKIEVEKVLYSVVGPPIRFSSSNFLFGAVFLTEDIVDG